MLNNYERDSRKMCSVSTCMCYERDSRNIQENMSCVNLYMLQKRFKKNGSCVNVYVFILIEDALEFFFNYVIISVLILTNWYKPYSARDKYCNLSSSEKKSFLY